MGHGEGFVAQDPRAPRTAAASTLLAGVLLVLGAANMATDLIGTSGPSTEEFAAFGAAMFFLVVSRVASSEREIPELTTPQLNQGGAEYLETQTRCQPDNGFNFVEHPRFCTIRARQRGR